MTDAPPRLLEDGALTPDERRALEVGASDRSPVGAKAAIWGALSLKLAAPATAAAATLTATSATTATATLTATSATTATLASGAAAGNAAAAGGELVTTLALVKSASIGLALGAAVGAGLYLGGRPAPAPPREHPLVFLEGAPSVTAPFHDRAAAARVPTASDSASAAPAPPSVSAADPRGESARAERTHDALPVASESQRVARARTQLRAGDPTRALETLGALERDEPKGLLAQEREALTIEALASLGRRDDARARADAFLARYPTSPHVLAVRRAAGYAP